MSYQDKNYKSFNWKLKLYLFSSISLLINFTFCVQGSISDEENPVFKKPEKQNELKYHKSSPDHLVLIYDGGNHRSIKWDKAHFKPYVSGNIDGKDKWLFDGFLFLEIHNGNGRGFASGYQPQAARKTEWEKLLTHWFRKENGIDALENQIEETLQQKDIKGNFEKRKIIISLPEPIPSQLDWGELDGKNLLFSNKQDRINACKWFIDYAEKLFKEANFKNIELVGFYWLAEEATNSRNIASEIADYIYEKEYDFYWIPYFHSDGYEEWKELGFNHVYYQPNYFFRMDTPYSQLQEACDRAKKNQMNLEVEFDERVLKDTKDWGNRLNDYLDVYEKNGVFDSLRVAYYQGGDAFYKLSQSKEPADVKLYNRLMKIISEKSKKK